MPTAESGELQRRLGLGDAVVVGAGSMVGAGVFVAWAPAAEAAGTALLVGLVIAGVIAFCNAASSAQLAAVHPRSGGTYVYGREQLGPGWGHLAGWGFVVGKTASCSAMALAIGAYLWPEQERWVAMAAVAAVAAVNLGGLSRTVAVTRVLLVVALATIAVVVGTGWFGGAAGPGGLEAFDLDPLGILRSAGFLFFAFAGYARIATLGEEVRDPAVTIPKAVPRALFAVLVLYAVVGVTLLAVVPASEVAASAAPLRLVLETAGVEQLAPLVGVGATIAAAGVLLNLIPGVSRTVLAMARERELPSWLAAVDGRRSLPVRAELTVTAVVMVLTLTLDLRGAIAVSGVAVLTYYAVTNASALTLTPEQRRWPAWIAWSGLVGCVVLVLALPANAVLGGLIVILIGVMIRWITTRRTGGR